MTMKKRVAIASSILILLLVGLSGFAGAGYLNSKAQLEEKELLISQLESRISSLEEGKELLTNQEAEKDLLISQLESRISSLEEEEKAPTLEESKFSPEIVEQAREVGLQARKSVVVLAVPFESGSGGGTGWFLENGIIITNEHVVANLKDGSVITGYTLDGDTFRAQVINYSVIPDIAVLRTDYTNAPPLPVGSSNELTPGQPLVQVGHPGGIGNWVISLGGYVSMEGDSFRGDVPGRPGVSGSPILTLDGKVVGLTNGSTPAEPSEANFAGPGTPPSNSEVVQSFSMPATYSTHSSIELVLEKVAEWAE